MGRIDRIITPKLHGVAKRNALALGTGTRGIHINHALIARAPKAQRNIVQILNERTVHQHIEAGENAARHLGMMTTARHKLLEYVASKAPNGLSRPHRISVANALNEINEPRLVLGFHGLPAQNCQAINKGMVETLDNLVLDGTIERLARSLATVTRDETARLRAENAELKTQIAELELRLREAGESRKIATGLSDEAIKQIEEQAGLL